MTYALLFEIAWKSLVTSGAALLLLGLLQGRTAGERSWIAHAGLLATLLLPAAIVLLPNWQVDAPISLPGESAAPALAEVAAPLPASPAAAPATVDLWALSVWAYALPAALLLLATLVAVLRLFAMRRRASVMVEPAWLSALAHAQRRMGFKHGTALLVSDELTSPVSWGLLRPIILLNQEAVRSGGDAEAIISHELAHVARLDWAKLILARAATALFWFNPLVWILARNCHQLREEAADDAVLRSDVRETEYAALLVAAARHENKGLLLAAHGVAPSRDSLKRRVTRILDKGQSRAPARAGWITVCSAGTILVSAPLAALTPVTPLPASAPAVAKLERPVVLAAPVRLARAVSPPAVPVPASIPAPPAAPAAARAVAAAAAAAPASASAAKQPLELASRGDDRHTPATRIDRNPPRLPTPQALVAMKVHGVSPQFVAALAAISPRYSRLTPDELVSLRIHGVSAARVGELHALGYRDLGVGQLTSLAIHGVTPAFIREMTSLGFPRLSVGTLTSMRTHGVTPAYVREFRAAGYDDVTAAELVNMRIHGVSVADARRAGP
ncbi:MAG TPA: M56 family metallopeptidase [Allosphingosinicella sp.]|jgi:beta-lactamase regulating signal transducer with metallopeptidase domain